MAGFLPMAALSAVQAGMERSQQDAQRKASHSAQLGEYSARAQSEAAHLALAQQQQDRDRRDRLRRAVATQRARFGAQGLSDSESANAVLAGLATEADREAADAAATTSLRLSRLSDEYGRRRNLLEASQPRNRLPFSMLQRGLRTVPLIDE